MTDDNGLAPVVLEILYYLTQVGLSVFFYFCMLGLMALYYCAMMLYMLWRDHKKDKEQ